MNVLLLYASPNKTTQGVTRELSKLFMQNGQKVVELNIGAGENRNMERIDDGQFAGVDLIGIGSPVYHMEILGPLQIYLERVVSQIAARNPNVHAFVYLTYAGVTTGKAFINTANLLQKHNIPLIGSFKVKAPHFWNTANFPDENAIRTIDEFYSQMEKKNFVAMDWARVHQVFSNQKLIIRILYPFIKFIGKKRRQPIIITPDLCSRCQKCSRECPVTAIEIIDKPRHIPEKCIYCYHCTTVCPKGAIGNCAEQVERIVKLNKKIAGLEEPQNQIFF